MRERWRRFFLVLFIPSILAVSFALLGAQEKKEEKPPDREMVRMMELLQDWEIIRNMDLLRDLDGLERQENPAAGPSAQSKTKERKK